MPDTVESIGSMLDSACRALFCNQVILHAGPMTHALLSLFAQVRGLDIF
jgi:hypothetical protein